MGQVINGHLGLAPALLEEVEYRRKGQAVAQGLSDRFWQAEARSEETKRFIRDIKRITRHRFTAEEKIRIVVEGFRRDTPIRDLCRREGIRPSTYYAWLKDFMEAGKIRDITIKKGVQ